MIHKFNFKHYVCIVALFVYGLTAYYSSGYFSADEHYQIIEFAGLLNGNNTANDLPWEYQAKIRPSIQPILTYLIFEGCHFFSLTDPYTKAFILRLLTALLSVIIIYYFTNKVIDAKLIKSKKLFLFLSYFLWFLPFVNVRFSSETWSGLFFLLAMALIININKNKYSYWYIGLLLGVSFLFRYQISFAILGVVLWLFFIKKEAIKNILACCFSILFVIFIGFLLDTLFYKEPTFTPYNYFIVNIIEDKASEFGVTPWYSYFLLILLYAIPPIGLIIVSSFVFLVVKRKRNLFTWVIVPFYLIHTLVPHKELRFLFPLINFLPIIIVIFWDYFSKKTIYRNHKKIIHLFYIMFLSINILFLFFANLRAAGNGKSAIEKKIHQLNMKKQLTLFVTDDYYPKYEWTLNSNFYQESNAKFKKINPSNLKELYTLHTDNTNLFIVSLKDLNKDYIKEINSKMIEVETTFPKFLFPIFKMINLDNKVFILYKNKKRLSNK
ncbi:hypothetical protein [Polaribacter sp.]|uniref:hypothetical protein n=1 Tax=Polaribacter sp. TaxID=1920175 RepID=UPI003F6B1F52